MAGVHEDPGLKFGGVVEGEFGVEPERPADVSMVIDRIGETEREELTHFQSRESLLIEVETSPPPFLKAHHSTSINKKKVYTPGDIILEGGESSGGDGGVEGLIDAASRLLG